MTLWAPVAGGTQFLQHRKRRCVVFQGSSMFEAVVGGDGSPGGALMEAGDQECDESLKSETFGRSSLPHRVAVIYSNMKRAAAKTAWWERL